MEQDYCLGWVLACQILPCQVETSSTCHDSPCHAMLSVTRSPMALRDLYR